MKRILSLFFLSSTAILAMDGDEKDLTTKPKMHWSDSIEDSITELVKMEELKAIEGRIAKRQAATLKKELDARWNTRKMLDHLRAQEIAFQLQDPDSLARLVASTSTPGFTVAKIGRKRPQTAFKSRFGGGK